MSGALVPAAGAIADDAVTNAQQKDNLEDLAEAARRMLGVGTGSISTYEIASGSIAPTTGIVQVKSEGGAATDNLDHIDVGSYAQNSVILVTGYNSLTENVTLRSAQGGSGQFSLQGGGVFSIADPWAFIVFRLKSTTWVELGRSYGSNAAAARARLGLGTVATLDNGTVNAATLQGLAAAAFLLAGETAADSSKLGGLLASAFLRADLASLQTIAGSLRAASGIIESAVASAGGAPRLQLSANGVARTQVFYDGATGFTTWRLLAVDGTTVLGGFRVRPLQTPEWWDASALTPTWVPLFTIGTPSPWLNRIRWDRSGATSRVSGAGNFILYSGDLPVLPGAGPTRIFRIKAGIHAQGVVSPQPRFRARIYIGNAGDDTDTLMFESDEVIASVSIPLTPFDAIVDDEFSVPAGSKITLVLFKQNASSLDVMSSVFNTYTVQPLTYLRVEQIG